ncbi:NAD(P)/FAD-dependent oxidoreductase [Lacipirellula parvula]|uniref:FAD-binding domain-containing protein n=1 Tax=Lacipirellula parvula TaxID=2650471 RepID=A0A5K7XKH1_9BACT|nr:FAD-dependent oxidoreductase [Lacipirellula parvula]BBO33429.1 hypothetical protein PLANPX_3041 [Lacipirellula parvula]
MNARAHWNVVVIGAGPAGSVAAYQLARAGLQVALIERSDGPRYKVCGGCLNQRGLSVLEQCGLGDVVRDQFTAPLRQIVFHRDARQIAINGQVGAIVNRATFDAALAAAAVQAGAQLFGGVKAIVEPLDASTATHESATRAISLQRIDGSHYRILTDFVVVADGLGRPSLQRLAEFDAVTARNSRLGIGVTPSAALASAGYEPATLSMALADDGYLGVARLADGRLCIGAAIDAAVARRGALDRWISGTIARCELPAINGLTSASIRGTRPLTQRPARTASHRIVLIGDAAGYTEPITGEGMAWGLAAAVAVTPFALKACREWRSELAAAWGRTLRRDVYGGQYVNRLLAATLRRPHYARRVFAAAAALPSLTAPIVRHLNRPQAVARIEA